ncbi:hypothetical protein Tco_1357103 [Tanacetum coccineum]
MKLRQQFTAAPATQKIEVSLQSSSISSNYATKFLNFDNIPSAETEIISMMDIKVQHEDPSIQTSPLLTKPITVIPKSSTAPTTTIPPPILPFISLQQQSTPIPTPTTIEATTSTIAVFHSETLSAIHLRVSDLEKEVKELKNHKALYHALMESILEDEDAMDKGVADKLKKRKSDDTDRDEGPLAGPDQGLKRKKTCKEIEPSKKVKSTGTSKGTTKSQPKAIGKSAQAKETVFEAGDTQVAQNIREDTGNTDESPVVKADPKDWFKKPKRPPTSDPKWNEGKTIDNKPTQKWLSDLAKAETSSKKFDDLTSTLIDFSAFVMNRLQISDLTQDILIVPVDYFFNNDLACLQGGSTDRTYTTSLTKKKAAKYDLPRIEDMGPKRQRFYGYASKRVSKHDVYSTKRILAVTNVKVNIWYSYGHLEEIEVRRSDQQLYKFMEGDFP